MGKQPDRCEDCSGPFVPSDACVLDRTTSTNKCLACAGETCITCHLKLGNPAIGAMRSFLWPSRWICGACANRRTPTDEQMTYLVLGAPGGASQSRRIHQALHAPVESSELFSRTAGLHGGSEQSMRILDNVRATQAAAAAASVPVIEDVIKVQALGEENGNSWEYVVRVADIPGGLDEFLRQVELVGKEQAQCYRNGVPIDWKDVTDEEKYDEYSVTGGLLRGLISPKAIWKIEPKGDGVQQTYGYRTPVNQRIVWAGPVFTL